MRIPDHLTCLLRNLYVDQKATVRTGHGTKDWFQIWKGVRQGCIVSPCLFYLYARLDKSAAIKIAGSNITNFRYTDDTSLRAKSEEELKSLLMSATMESQKAGLKLNIKKNKIMSSSPIISLQVELEKVETVAYFIFLGSKITVESDCSHKIKRCLLLRRNAMTKLDSIVKSRDITLPTKVWIVKVTVFPGVMYRCESWTIKKA